MKTHNEAPPACSAGGAISYASKTVSRVLYLTAIYLDALLPVRSSHLLEAAGQACCFRATVLLRIEFTASRCSHVTGELLPRLSTLTSSSLASYPLLRRKRQSTVVTLFLFAPQKLRFCRGPISGDSRRYISVALFLRSLWAGVTRYPCPTEPGLSS